MKYTEGNKSNDMAEGNQSHQLQLASQKLQPYLYLKINLTIDEEKVDDLDGNQYKFLIHQALKETLGQVGAATPVDVLSRDKGNSLIRIPSVKSEKVWAALTLYGTTPAGKRCAFRIMKSSPFLMGLACESRNHWEATSS